jgi:hypothetical protein
MFKNKSNIILRRYPIATIFLKKYNPAKIITFNIIGTTICNEEVAETRKRSNTPIIKLAIIDTIKKPIKNSITFRKMDI